MDIERIIEQMTVEEKAALVSGADFMYTNPIPRLGVPRMCTSDGPHGLRKQIGSGDNGVSQNRTIPTNILLLLNPQDSRLPKEEK